MPINLSILIYNLLILSNDVELNPGPLKDSSKGNFSIAHWNFNSTVAQNFVKLSQLEAYNTMHSYDLISPYQNKKALSPFYHKKYF